VTDFGLGSPPDELDDVAKEKWHALTAGGQWGADLVICDRDLFTQYCRLASRKQKADEKIDELGALVEGKDGFPIQNPWLAVSNKAWADMLVIARELGGTPKSRERMDKTSVPIEDCAISQPIEGANEAGFFYDGSEEDIIRQALSVH